MKKTCETCREFLRKNRATSCVLKGIPVRPDYGCDRHRFSLKTESYYDEIDKEKKHEQTDDHR